MWIKSIHYRLYDADTKFLKLLIIYENQIVMIAACQVAHVLHY